MTYNFSIPDKFLGLIESGQINRFGALLKDVDSGQIVGHLQETPLLSQAISKAGLNPISTLIEAGNTVQLYQMNSKLSDIQSTLGIMQGLQVATLATSVIGIGVSVASAMIICKRIDQVRGDIQQLSEDFKDFRDEWKITEFQSLLDQANTCVERIETIHTRKKEQQAILLDAENVLHNVFNAAISNARYFETRQDIPPLAFRIILETLMLSSMSRIKTLLLLDEGDEAKNAAKLQVEKLSDLTLALPRDQLITKFTDQVSAPRELAEQISMILSEARLQMASTPYLVEQLNRSGIAPSEYITAANDETEEPFLFLEGQH